MIDIKNKKDCSGCTACYNVCPTNAIEMVIDEEGFKYPKINKDKCIKCNLCSKICPMLKNKEDDTSNIKCYGAYNKNNDIKKNSTSGGFFSALAEKIIDKNGVVYGAKFDKDFNVIHYGTDKIEKLQAFRGSKYVKSELDKIFTEIKEILEQNRLVLFSGTPCEVYGLKAFLQKDYENLICAEVICHGVPSPLYYKKYRESKIKKYKSNITKLSFREKTYGYSSSTMTIKFENGKKYSRGHESDEMIKAFMRGYCSRESCYDCRFKSFGTVGDFKIGDLWNVEGYLGEEFKDGATLVITCSSKAEKILEELKDKIGIKEINKEKAEYYNGNGGTSMILHSANRPNERDTFLKDTSTMDFKNLRNKYLKMTYKEYAKMKLKPILYKMKLLDKIKSKSR